MFSNINKTIIKYILCAFVIFLIIAYLPKSKLSSNQYVLIGITILGIYIILDSISYNSLFSSKNTINNKYRRENFNQLNTTEKIKKIASNDTPNNTITETSQKSSESPKSETPPKSETSPKSSETPVKKPIKVVKKIIPVTTESSEQPKKVNARLFSRK